jgi:hypothetical protein
MFFNFSLILFIKFSHCHHRDTLGKVRSQSQTGVGGGCFSSPPLRQHQQQLAITAAAVASAENKMVIFLK